MVFRSKMFKLLVLAGLVFNLTACGTAEKQTTEAPVSTPAPEISAEAEQAELEWDIQPPLGIVKGDYYSIEERFRQGHLGILEIVKQDDKLVYIEFNEMTRPNYYERYFQNVPKRLSEYNFSMGDKKGAAWVQSVVAVEKQMIEEQRVTGEFDTISGASNSVNQSMIPLAEKLAPLLDQPSAKKYYSIAEKLGGGLTGFVQVVIENGKITSVRYDEIFANTPEEIEDPALKAFYRQSKYESVEYQEPSRIGFNIQMDALNAKVVETQDLLDLNGLPSTDESGDYASSGFTIRNTAWDNYLKLAGTLLEEIKKDGALN
ncbi:MAG: FMN-binding protein [Acidaminobacter sp.]|uniref:FMN-binding protein n=1 Tax=Acidaminobacter sp. TaxID=1872102 RepID=UPI00138313A6|nr:FMN-binding protein [Acidaminobacter sp.]MZQ99719.1 FMN-binding protein [Acidaminobacter sp.]